MTQPLPGPHDTTVSPIVKPKVSYIAVTPDMATRWLTQNSVNRILRRGNIEKYARDMRAGRWTVSNDAICFDASGKLLNGQHRLNAVILAEVSVVMMVVRDMPTDSMTTMDTGTARTASDALGFAGERNAHYLAALAKMLVNIDSGNIYRDTYQQRVSHSEIVQYVETHPTTRSSVIVGARTSQHLDATPTVLGATHFLISRKCGNTLATYYLDQLAGRENEPSGSAVLAIDSRLREIRRNRSRYPQRNFLYLLIKGWNAYATDRRVRTLTMQPARGEFRLPEVSPWRRDDPDVAS